MNIGALNPHGVGSCRRKRGSTLLIAVIFTTILSVTAGSIISRVMHEQRIADRAAERATLMYLAEGYIEKAIWSVQNTDWTGWDSFNEGADRYMPYTKVKLGERTAYVHALVIGAENNPTIYAEATTYPANGKDINRQLRIQYDAVTTPPSSGGGIPGGLIGKDTMSFSGQPIIDSYDSRIGPPDPFLNRGDRVTVATISRSSDALGLSGQVDIFGFAGTGKAKPNISGPQNKILGADSEPGSNIDWTRVYNDFVFDFPEIEQPNWSGAIKTVPEPKNKTITIGTPGKITRYDGKELKLSGNSKTKLRVAGPVQMRLSDGVSTSGQAYIEIVDGGSLEIYTVKDVNLSGQAVVNKTSVPANLKIFGTVGKEKDQSFTLSGQGMIEAVVYAPNAVVQVSGQGDFAGSIVGYEIKYSGQGNFHYDVSLGGDDGGDGEEEVTGGEITGWHDTSPIEYNFDIKSYLRKKGGVYQLPI